MCPECIQDTSGTHAGLVWDTYRMSGMHVNVTLELSCTVYASSIKLAIN